LKHHATPAFRIKATPGKGTGTGLFSTRAIKMGGLILSERPLFVAARVPYTPDVEKYFQLSVSRMHPDAKSAFMALASSLEKDGSGPIIGIVRRHGLTLDGLPSGSKLKNILDSLHSGGKAKNETYRAICKIISRLSHRYACLVWINTVADILHSNSPNTEPRFDLRSFSYRLFAVRDIAAGEELTSTDTYLDCLEPPERTGKPTFEHNMMSMDGGPIFQKPCEKSLLELSLRMWLRDDTLPDDWLITKCREQLTPVRLNSGKDLTNDDLLLRLEAMHTLMQAYICLGDAQNASQWAVKLDKVFKRDDKNIKALLNPASAAYPANSFWRRRVDRELAKNIPQPVLVQSTILFPMEWWH
jgi:hypothetical protein